MNFGEFIEYYRCNVSEDLITAYEFADELSEEVEISEEAHFDKDVYIGKVKRIGADTRIGRFSILSDGVTIGDNVSIDRETYIGDDVIIGSHADIGARCYLDSGVIIPKDYSRKSHEYMRSTGNGIIIGPNVKLPSEYQIGSGAIIPSSKSIGQIGRFGSFERMVTAYGTDRGPLYGVGCQFGIDGAAFYDRIIDGTETNVASAAQYKKNFSKIEELGARVQAEYDLQKVLVSELKDKKNQYYLTNDIDPLAHQLG